ncbi:hypothetical protein OEIGOIKO_05811 [Streptomyces chrestomyceticus JCM 4735]|uniref:Uncharacterized protein n=1 Tax=Streptomyces chrestomyceticus JCM 4735 TaxID=1306181 RepID=A0A7U9L1R5_9ACTN|nr:hypothetical protein [Streptomyces chrestomyceticus]GCD38001.1 hypothetical protein OEIGOIKO_05811 [Streptomyces chrestomyceticus JCM 4735]
MTDPRPVELQPPAALTLQRAEEYLTAHGWCQDTMNGPDGTVCAAGAIRAVAPPLTRGQTSPEERAALAALAVHLGGRPAADPDNPIGTHPMEVVTDWNDQAAGVDEVLAAFRGAIADLHASGPPATAGTGPGGEPRRHTEPLHCRWCGHLLTPARTDWWDDRPQCRNKTTCDQRAARTRR